MDGQENQQIQTLSVDQKIFSAKCGTKGEVYRFLATEAMVYLPSYDTVTIWHLKELASGKKRVRNQLFFYWVNFIGCTL